MKKYLVITRNPTTGRRYHHVLDATDDKSAISVAERGADQSSRDVIEIYPCEEGLYEGSQRVVANVAVGQQHQEAWQAASSQKRRKLRRRQGGQETTERQEQRRQIRRQRRKTGMNIKERADAAIKRVNAMSRDEFESKLHELDYYPRRLDESMDDYLVRMEQYKTEGASR